MQRNVSWEARPIRSPAWPMKLWAIVKQGIGKAVGSEKLQAEGLMQEAKGEAQKAMGDAKDGIKNAANKTADAINNKL